MVERGRGDDASGVVPVHVLLPTSILFHSPSCQDGVHASVEREHRFFGCELIQEAGVLLRLPQVVMVTAQTMLHRFYYRKSLRDFDAFRVAFACVFLAAKVEERPKRIKDVLSVFYALYRRRKAGKTSVKQQLLDLESGTYCLWRDWLIMVERQVLIDLGFSVYNVMEHPHKYILYYIKIIDGSQKLAQKAWGFINDSLRIDLCVRYEAEVIACAAIFLASRFLQVHLPENPPWYSLFDVEKQALYDVSIEIMGLYSRERVQWLDPLTEVNPFADDNDADIDEHGDAEDGSKVSMQEGSIEEQQQQQTVDVAVKQSPLTVQQDVSPQGLDESASPKTKWSRLTDMSIIQKQALKQVLWNLTVDVQIVIVNSNLHDQSDAVQVAKEIVDAEVGAKNETTAVGLEIAAVGVAETGTSEEDEAAAPAVVRVAVTRPRDGEDVEAEVAVAAVVDDVTTS
uniref:Cyclin-like domain-containing protein n=1 Tax=Globisporangium ultimum (strain ATCC 200006 / CBS 805.95 / DAOM BR144) TaxID=431595 RepID=K3WRL9_GLOUD